VELATLESKARRFFDAFVEAFESFDGAKIAERYTSPYLAFHANGRSDVFSSSQDIAEYFQGVLDQYHEKGVRSCSFENLAVVRAGRESAFATVTWKLHAQGGNVLLAWRESYNLWLRGDRCLVFSSTDHVE
jgi:ketosteroid isomerase-like protein